MTGSDIGFDCPPQATDAGLTGIFGGTFDPFHAGHLALARHFIQRLSLKRLILIPAGQPWQKNNVSDAKHRLVITTLGAQILRTQLAQSSAPPLHPPLIEISQYEIQRAEPSYTVLTLQAIRQRWGPVIPLCLILGLDQLHQLHRWHAWQSLFNYAHVCVASRPPYSNHTDNTLPLSEEILDIIKPRQTDLPGDLHKEPAGKIFLDTELNIDISSTALRQKLSTGQKISPNELPSPIYNYILEHRLYQKAP